MTDLTLESAADALHQLLAQQSKLEQEKAEENRLARLAADQKQQELDLQARQLELDQQAERRREHRLNEVLQRLIAESEARGETITFLEQVVSKLTTLDDAFGDMIDQLFGNQEDILRAIYALLSHNKADIAESTIKIRYRLELIQRQENLNRLQLRAAQYGSLNVPTNLANEIEAEERRIEELQALLDD